MRPPVPSAETRTARRELPTDLGTRPLTPVADALASLVSARAPVPPRSVAVCEAAGRVVAGPLVVGEAVPRQSIALRAGWAVAASDVVGASAYAPAILAAAPDWVDLCGELPEGADAVLLGDALVRSAGFAEILASAPPGEGVRRAGEDARAGTVLRETGDRLRPVDLAILRAAGIETCPVRQARVTVLLAPGAEAAGDLVGGLTAAAGASVVRPECPDAASLATALVGSGGDLAVVIGGDPTRRAVLDLLAHRGSLVASALALRPGEMTACGHVENALVVAMPARLEGALAATLALVLPCLDHLMAAKPGRPVFCGPLTRKIASSIGVTEIALLREVAQGLEPVAVGDLTLAAIANAQAWLAIPPGSEGLAAGARVQAAAI